MEGNGLDVEGRLPEGLAHLYELALNLRWSWDRETRALFREIDPALWDQIEDNPWLVLLANSRRRLEALAGDTAFTARAQQCYAALQRYMAERGWFHQAYPQEEEAL